MDYVQKLVDVLDRGNCYQSEFINGKLYVVELKEEMGDNGLELNSYYCFTLPFETESDADEWFERISDVALEVSGMLARMNGNSPFIVNDLEKNFELFESSEGVE